MPTIVSNKIVATTGAAAVIAAGVVLAGPADAAAKRGTTHLKATAKHTVTVAATMRPGLANLHNDGTRDVLIMRKKHDGAYQLAAYLNGKKDSDFKKLFTRFTFVDSLERHADHYVKLPKGTYYFVGEAGKVKATNIRTVTVRGKGVDAVRPAGTRSLTVGSKGALTGSTVGTARPYLRVRNTTKTLQFVGIYEIKSEATEDQIADLMAHPTYDKLFDLVDEDNEGDGVIVGPGQDVTSQLALAKGRYLELSYGGSKLTSRQIHRLTLS